ncbi:hypothetical protein E2562_006343 [Oryza meyeriana var. granulata]|uniref:Uncharacterized protein n=1 Tax=Oryza meyeriana var. granulata TaxID=110450 RepID=A0A6G1EEC9_9ORYZ|nr:hypothetical protein E2562_006343 [Oryza meyeriana var. granulata]
MGFTFRSNRHIPGNPVAAQLGLAWPIQRVWTRRRASPSSALRRLTFLSTPAELYRLFRRSGLTPTRAATFLSV